MYDHVMVFPDEGTALAALPSGYVTEDENGDKQFKLSKVLLTDAVTQAAVWDNSDPENPVLTTPRQVAPGFWLVIASKTLDPDLTALSACRVVADRTLSGTKTPAVYDNSDPENPVLISGNEPVNFFVYMAADIDLGQLSAITFAPVIAGTNYPFGDLPS